jgi:L-asparaginase
MGVLVVLNDEISSAREVTKSNAGGLHTFETRGYGVLGTVDPDRVKFYRTVLARHTARSEFDVATIRSLPRVDVLLVYQGAPGDLIKASVDNGAKGIVLATAGAGSVSGTQAEAVDYALDRGVIVVTGTRTGGGRIPPSAVHRQTSGTAAVADIEEQRFRIGAEDIQPIKARILLMLALTRTSDPLEIQRMFSDY